MISFTGIVVYKSKEFYRVPCRKSRILTETLQAKLFSEHANGKMAQEYLIKRLQEDKIPYTIITEQTMTDFEKLKLGDIENKEFIA